LGRKPEADAALAEYIANNQNEGAFQIAEILAFRGEIDRAFEWLDRAYAQRDGGLTEMKGDPLLKNLENRLAALLHGGVRARRQARAQAPCDIPIDSRTVAHFSARPLSVS
jgi:hypothetical protein